MPTIPTISADYETLLWGAIIAGFVMSTIRAIMAAVVVSPDGKSLD